MPIGNSTLGCSIRSRQSEIANERCPPNRPRKVTSAAGRAPARPQNRPENHPFAQTMHWHFAWSRGDDVTRWRSRARPAGEAQMRASYTKSLWGRAAGVAGLGALVFTYGCGAAQNAAGVRAQELTAGQAGTPVVVSCEPHQRTLVRPAIVNGAQVSQVECVAADPAATYAQQAYAATQFA